MKNEHFVFHLTDLSDGTQSLSIRTAFVGAATSVLTLPPGVTVDGRTIRINDVTYSDVNVMTSAIDLLELNDVTITNRIVVRARHSEYAYTRIELNRSTVNIVKIRHSNMQSVALLDSTVQQLDIEESHIKNAYVFDGFVRHIISTQSNFEEMVLSKVDTVSLSLSVTKVVSFVMDDSNPRFNLRDAQFGSFSIDGGDAE